MWYTMFLSTIYLLLSTQILLFDCRVIDKSAQSILDLVPNRSLISEYSNDGGESSTSEKWIKGMRKLENMKSFMNREYSYSSVIITEMMSQWNHVNQECAQSITQTMIGLQKNQYWVYKSNT